MLVNYAPGIKSNNFRDHESNEDEIILIKRIGILINSEIKL